MCAVASRPKYISKLVRNRSAVTDVLRHCDLVDLVTYAKQSNGHRTAVESSHRCRIVVVTDACRLIGLDRAIDEHGSHL